MKKLNHFQIILLSAFAAMPLLTSARETLFNNGWRFTLDADSTCVVPGLDDSNWRMLNLPHDWSIELPFDKDAPSGNDGGYLPTGTGWYRKTFTIDDLKDGNIYKLKIGGAYMDSEVFVNGKKAGGHPYGYSSYFTDITPFLKKGDNVIAIKVDNSAQKNCRWYSGSGLYRDVTLRESGPVRLSDFSSFVRTPDLTTAEADVFIDNKTPEARRINVTVEINGKSESREVEVPANSENFKASLKVSVPDAKPWSPDSPQLYDCNITLSENGEIIDRLTHKTGFRTLEWNAKNGLKLNGKEILLNGGCVHHDNGILGAAAHRDAERRRARLLKEAGFNAVRTSHNLPSEIFLDACDEYGLLVIDEAFDGWRHAKNDHDYHKLFDSRWQEDIDAMVLRDRNHPSIFCWSIGNEVIERKQIEVVTTAHKLASRCRELDTTRPVTSALAAWDSDWEIYDPLAAEHDITGYNYMIHKSESDHERAPSRVMMQTESYPAHAWWNYRQAADHPYVIGDFVWTAIDYIGESGIGRFYYEGEPEGEHWVQPLYPWHAAYCGDIDLTGQRKPISHYRSMLWNPDGEQLYMAVKEPDGYYGKIKTTMWSTWPTSESWNWEGHEGKPVQVEVYSRYPKVRLSLNGETISEKAVENMTASFEIPYQPGLLKAEGIDPEGKSVESKTLTTAGKPAAIRLKNDHGSISHDGSELSFITIEIVDRKGNLVPVADNTLKIDVSGGELVAFGNADIKDEDPYFDATHKVWKGRALAVVRGNGKKGSLKVKVTSPGLPSSSQAISLH